MVDANPGTASSEPQPAQQQPVVAGSGRQKKAWPELVGATYEHAVEVVQREAPDVTSTPRVKEGSFVTMDYRLDRVRIYVSAEEGVNRVIAPPRRG